MQRLLFRSRLFVVRAGRVLVRLYADSANGVNAPSRRFHREKSVE